MIAKNQNGGTLIEAIMAMLILSLLLVGLNASVLSMIKTNLSSKELSFATSSAYSLIEDLKRRDFTSINSSSDVINNKFLRSWKVTTDNSQKKIDLIVYWPVSTQKHKIELSTIIAKQ